MDKRRNGFALLRSCFFDSADIVRAGFERHLRGSWVCGSLWHGSVDGDGSFANVKKRVPFIVVAAMKPATTTTATAANDRYITIAFSQ